LRRFAGWPCHHDTHLSLLRNDRGGMESPNERSCTPWNYLAEAHHSPSSDPRLQTQGDFTAMVYPLHGYLIPTGHCISAIRPQFQNLIARGNPPSRLPIKAGWARWYIATGGQSPFFRASTEIHYCHASLNPSDDLSSIIHRFTNWESGWPGSPVS